MKIARKTTEFPKAPQNNEVAIMLDEANSVQWVCTAAQFAETTLAAVKTTVYLERGAIKMPLRFPEASFEGEAILRFTGGTAAARQFMANVMHNFDELESHSLFACFESPFKHALMANPEADGDVTALLQDVCKKDFELYGFQLVKADGARAFVPERIAEKVFTIGRKPAPGSSAPTPRIALTLHFGASQEELEDFMHMSRAHAEFSIENGALFITDKSKNGTFVNGVRIDGKTSVTEGEITFASAIAPPYRRLAVAVNGQKITLTSQCGSWQVVV